MLIDLIKFNWEEFLNRIHFPQYKTRPNLPTFFDKLKIYLQTLY